MKQRQAQRILNKLCDEHRIPRITVINDKGIGAALGKFHYEPPRISLRQDADISVLLHEFTHYLIHLVTVAESLEEAICDYTPERIESWMKENNIQ